MEFSLNTALPTKPLHSWLHPVSVAWVPGPSIPILEETKAGMMRQFQAWGHQVQEQPDPETDLILTTAVFGEPVSWRQAPIFGARKRYGLKRTPVVCTLLHATPAQLQRELAYLEELLTLDPQKVAREVSFPGLAPHAWHVLYEQGNRGGPILALQRLLQSQAKSIRLLLVIGEEHPLEAYHFDLVGAFPQSKVDPPGSVAGAENFYEDIVLRIVTTLCTNEVTQHAAIGEQITRDQWEALDTPKAMAEASRELAQRNFFTEMVRIEDLIQVPAVADSVSSQYSEGCFATWEPAIGGLIATITGSAHPVDKRKITEDDLAVIVGIQPGGIGALVRHVEGKRNAPPSSEAVEMMEMDSGLPQISLDGSRPSLRQAPVVRSKLHGHRGVAAYNPAKVEYVPLDPAYYHYLVSCATEAQAKGVKGAFARSAALRNPDDPRQVVFTVLPGHGLIMVEKWIAGKTPFQTLLEYMDGGDIQVESRIPQGPMRFVPDSEGRMVLQAE
ncbi:MAG: hypothetical protein HY326_09520 [Chloroflexi bacterium]|nr:hypothetical protein [Chloroflexota bacterium]